jgi:hypothetical protein
MQKRMRDQLGAWWGGVRGSVAAASTEGRRGWQQHCWLRRPVADAGRHSLRVRG